MEAGEEVGLNPAAVHPQASTAEEDPLQTWCDDGGTNRDAGMSLGVEGRNAVVAGDELLAMKIMIAARESSKCHNSFSPTPLLT